MGFLRYLVVASSTRGDVTKSTYTPVSHPPNLTPYHQPRNKHSWYISRYRYDSNRDQCLRIVALCLPVASTQPSCDTNWKRKGTLAAHETGSDSDDSSHVRSTILISFNFNLDQEDIAASHQAQSTKSGILNLMTSTLQPLVSMHLPSFNFGVCLVERGTNPADSLA
jgi:hypothetical protein